MKNIKIRNYLAVLLVFAVLVTLLMSGGWAISADALAEEEHSTSEQAMLAEDITHHPFAESPYLDIRIVRQQGNTWVIKVTNTSNHSVTVEYNTLMCNEADARTWTKLNDIAKITLSAGASTQDYNPITEAKETHIQINPNWWAAYIAISYKYGGERYVTYGCDLHDNTQMSVSYTKIK